MQADGVGSAAIPANADDNRVPMVCERLLDRMRAAAGRVQDIWHLQRIVEHVEVLCNDFDERLRTNAEAEEAAALLVRTRQPAVIKQLAFYFSDSNLRHDRFLRSRFDADGYVPIDMVVVFNRLKALGCNSAQEVVDAVKAAPPGAGLELSSDANRMRRLGGVPPPPAAGAVETPQDRLVVRIEGFPRGDESVTVEAVKEQCARHGEVSHVWLVCARTRPGQDNPATEFLGAAEVEFKMEEAAAACVAADPPPTWTGKPLQLKSLSDFRAERYGAGAGTGGVVGTGAGTVSGTSAPGTKRPLESNLGGLAALPEGGPEMAKRTRIEEEASASAARFERGCILRIEEVPESMKWKDVKEAFETFGEVVYVDYQRGKPTFVRMRSAEGAWAAMDEVSKSGGILTLELPAEEDEGLPAPTESLSAPTPATAPKEAVVNMQQEGEAPPQSDPYGGGDLEQPDVPVEEDVVKPADVSMCDPYGGGEVAGEGDIVVEATKADEVDPFVVDVTGDGEGLVAAPAEESPAPTQTAPADDGTTFAAAPVTESVSVPAAPPMPQVPKTEGLRTTIVRLKVTLLKGDEEEVYLHRMALTLTERRHAQKGNAGKDCKGGSKGAKGQMHSGKPGKERGKDGWKERGKVGKEGGKGCKTSKEGKSRKKGGKKSGKASQRVMFDDSEDS